MAKYYLITESDIKRLKYILERDPEKTMMTQEEKKVYEGAFRGLNYHIQVWINDVTKDA